MLFSRHGPATHCVTPSSSTFQLMKLVLGCFDPVVRCCMQQPDLSNCFPQFLRIVAVVGEPDQVCLSMCHSVTEARCCSLSICLDLGMTTDLSALPQLVFANIRTQGLVTIVLDCHELDAVLLEVK